MFLKPLKIKAGQVYKRKKDGQQIVILNGKEHDWNCRILGGNRRVTHHIRKFDLVKYWELYENPTS